jgi:hypothetical protein
MKQEKLRRLLFVSAVCVLSCPWLTPCVGIWASAAVNGAHDSITKRDEPLNRLPDPRLKEWAAKPGPKLAVFEHQTISKSLLVTDEEVSSAHGGRNAPRPGTLVGKGASALVDGVSQTLNWVDPFTFATGNSLGVEPTKPKRRLILCESPFVMLEGEDVRFTREGKNGHVRLAKASNARVTVITPAGSHSASAGHIHYRGASQQVVLEHSYGVHNGPQFFRPAQPESLMTLNFVKHRVSCSGAVTDENRRLISKLRDNETTSPAVP